MTLFIKKENGLYEKQVETHYQRAYDLEEIKALLNEAGMEFVAAYDAFTRNPVHDKSERMYIIAKEGFQPNKKYNERNA